MRKQQLTNEQKIAVKLTNLLDSVSLDLDRVGIEIARLRPSTFYNRLILVAEAAVDEKEREVNLNGGNYLF
jgi:hypothetical protein